MRTYNWIFWAVLGVTCILCFSLFCFTFLARIVPLNYIALLIFTMGTSYVIAGICIYQAPETVLIAGALTFSIFFGLTVFTLLVRIMICQSFRQITS